MTAGLDPRLTSIVIVAADSGELLQDAVASTLAQSAPIELILVDNASSDGAPARALAACAGDARLRLIENGANLGFGPACNRGAAVARGGALLFQNPDCVLQVDTVARLRAALESGSGIGLLGVTVCNPDDSPARANRRRAPTLRRALMSALGLARFESRWPALAGIELPAADAGEALEDVDAVSGALMLLRREAFEAVGGFDEGYFLHAEDLDLCRRLRDAGWRVAVAGAIRVRHAQGSSSRHRPLFVAWHKHRGLWRYLRRFDPAVRRPLPGALAWLALWAHFALQAPWLTLRRLLRR